MSYKAEVERYVKDPSLLIELCREVIEQLDTGANNGETVAMEAQLREIARAIDKLEKQSVPVPDALRAEKTRLAAALEISGGASGRMNQLADKLEELVRQVRARGIEVPQKTKSWKPPQKSSQARTAKKVLRQLIIEALQSFGGSAPKKDVLQYMEQKLRGKLLPGDLIWREVTKNVVWQNNASWERFIMTQDGTMKNGSPRGIWELNEGHQ